MATVRASSVAEVRKDRRQVRVLGWAQQSRWRTGDGWGGGCITGSGGRMRAWALPWNLEVRLTGLRIGPFAVGPTVMSLVLTSAGGRSVRHNYSMPC